MLQASSVSRAVEEPKYSGLHCPRQMDESGITYRTWRSVSRLAVSPIDRPLAMAWHRRSITTKTTTSISGLAPQ